MTFAELIAKVRRIGDTARVSAPLIAEEIRALVVEGIEAKRSPDGAAWPAPVERSESTGETARSVRVVESGGVCRVDIGARHARYQSARRPMLPGAEVPSAWAKRLEGVARRAFDERAK